ncbi:hypothetical protein CBL_04170 [Carabus blaptoides fortunei]
MLTSKVNFDLGYQSDRLEGIARSSCCLKTACCKALWVIRWHKGKQGNYRVRKHTQYLHRVMPHFGENGVSKMNGLEDIGKDEIRDWLEIDQIISDGDLNNQTSTKISDDENDCNTERPYDVVSCWNGCIGWSIEKKLELRSLRNNIDSPGYMACSPYKRIV